MVEFILNSMIKICVFIVVACLVGFMPLKTQKRELNIVPKIEVLNEDKMLVVKFGQNKILCGAEQYNIWRTRQSPDAKIIEVKTLYLLGEKKKYVLDIY